MRKKKFEIKMVCEKCGNEDAVDKEMSTENWTVYNVNCDKCGGRIVLKFEE